jgi:hypothetical protein
MNNSSSAAVITNIRNFLNYFVCHYVTRLVSKLRADFHLCRLAVLLLLVVFQTLFSECLTVRSQNPENSTIPAVPPPKVDAANDERWDKEKDILSRLVKSMEEKFGINDKKWKIMIKEVWIPPLSTRSNARLFARWSRGTIDVNFILTDSPGEAGEFYHTGLQLMGDGVIYDLKEVGDEAVSIGSGFDPSGQVRFVRGRFYAYVMAGRPKYAEEIARFMSEQVIAIESELPLVPPKVPLDKK